MLKTNSGRPHSGYPLRAASTGLWSVIVDAATGQASMFGDGVMMRLLGLDAFPGPRQCYEYWFSRVHKDYVPYLGEMITKVITAGQHDEVEYVWLHPKWGEMHVRCGGYIVECQTGMVHTMGYHQDISELCYLRRHLKETLFRLRALTDLCGLGVFEMKLSSNSIQMLDSNAIFREQFGYVADDDMPMRVASNMPKEDKELWLSLFDPDEWEVGKRKHFRIEYMHPENGQRWLEITCECFRNEDETIKFIGHSHDMSSRHSHEALLLQAKVKSEEALLIRSVYHAANSDPHLSLEIDSKTMFSSKQQEGSFGSQGTPLLTARFEDLQHSGIIEISKIKIQKEPFNLHQDLRVWIPIMQLWAQHKKLSLRFLLDYTLPEYITGDSLRIRQVLCNLCDNAIHFTDSEEIFLSIRGASLESGSESQCRIIFTVCDTAYLNQRPQKLLSENIPPQNFVNRWARENGLDIGSSRHLVKMMGGILAQETLPDRGISFHFALNFNLPCAAAPL